MTIPNPFKINYDLGTQRAWTLSEKITFRFFTIFFLLQIDLLPTEDIVVLFGTKILGIVGLSGEANGSGDTTFGWVTLLFSLVVATIITIIWSILDSKRPSYNHAKYWIDLLVRYFLILMLFEYGIAKIFVGQMPVPTEGRLYQRIGDMSPMGMLWTFIGSSKPYQIFCGSSEILAATLLLFRRTQLFGALVSAIVLFQVFVLNMCYDVPVKIFSFLLLTLALYTAFPSVKRLYTFFFTNNAIPAIENVDLYPQKWFKTASWVLFSLFCGGILYSFYEFSQNGEEKEDTTSKLEGAYEIVSQQGILLDSIAWTHLNIRGYGSNFMLAGINDETGYRTRFAAAINDTTKQISVSNMETKDSVFAVLNYQQRDANLLVLNGLWKEDSVTINLKRRPKRDFLLLTRGFHWINEEPFNR